MIPLPSDLDIQPRSLQSSAPFNDPTSLHPLHAVPYTHAVIMASVAPAAADTSASHPYTCNTCQVAYRNSDLQKGHMKSDWQ